MRVRVGALGNEVRVRAGSGRSEQPTTRSNDTLPRSRQVTFSSCIKPCVTIVCDKRQCDEEEMESDLLLRGLTQMSLLTRSTVPATDAYSFSSSM